MAGSPSDADERPGEHSMEAEEALLAERPAPKRRSVAAAAGGLLAAGALLGVVVGSAVASQGRHAAPASVRGGDGIIGEAAYGEVASPAFVHPQSPLTVAAAQSPLTVAAAKPMGMRTQHVAQEASTAKETTQRPTTPPPTTTPAAPSTTEDKFASCPATGGDCRESKCCKDPGTQCFAKNEYWAECRASCDIGVHLTDPDDTPWTCKTLGERTPGDAVLQCSTDGEDCSKTQCCEAPGTQCYRKNEYWAACKTACVAGPDLMAPEFEEWQCAEVGPRTPGAAEWVAEKGAQQGQDCSQVGYCATEGQQCFRKNAGWAECRFECSPGFKENPWDTEWSCEAIGGVTPRATWPAGPPKGQVSAWVLDKCHGEGENCLDTKCCKSVGWGCRRKNEYWGQCLYQCPPEGAVAASSGDERRLAAKAGKAATNTTPAPKDVWDCSPVGPESWGLAVKGYPSLYCLSLYMPTSYEGGIINEQLEMGAGIFACDGYDVIAAEDVTVGTSKDGILVKTMVIPKISVGVSQDGTAGNAKLFMAMWDKVIAGKRFRDYDWTIKADPDAVLIPWRLRDHMYPHIGKNIYVVNCNAFPGSPNFPMMYGSVEIFSSAAMIAYAAGSWKCGQQLPWKQWGEDYYMTHCLDFLGVSRINDFSVVGDNVCTGSTCADGQASFHPYKTTEAWRKCWEQAVPPGT